MSRPVRTRSFLETGFWPLYPSFVWFVPLSRTKRVLLTHVWDSVLVPFLCALRSQDSILFGTCLTLCVTWLMWVMCVPWLIQYSCHAYPVGFKGMSCSDVWDMSHIWMSHVTHVNESCHVYEWAMPQICLSRVSLCEFQDSHGPCVGHDSLGIRVTLSCMF